MLIHVSPRAQHVSPIVGDAHIVLTIRPDGGLLLSGYLHAEWYATYANSKNGVVDEIPRLLAELREEIAARKAAATRSAPPSQTSV